MATKNRIAYALPIIQIIQILSDKFHKQMCLRLIYREQVAITSTPKTVLHHGFGGLLYSRHSSIAFSASPTPKPPAVRLTFHSTEKHHSYAVYKLTYRLGYSIIILIRVCLKSDRQKITDTKSCKRKDDTVDIRRFIFSVLLYGSVLYSIFHLP